MGHSSSHHHCMVECSCRQGCSKSKSGPGTPFRPFFRLPCLWALPSSACWQDQTEGQSARGCARRPYRLCPLGHAPRGSILCRAFSGANQSHASRGSSQQPCSCCYEPQINGTEGPDASYALPGTTAGHFSATLVALNKSATLDALGQVCYHCCIKSSLLAWDMQSAVAHASCI